MAQQKIDSTVEQEKDSNPRQELQGKIEDLRHEVDNLYLQAVVAVNQELIAREQQIGANMVEAVSQNLEEIRSGTGSLPGYHAREVAALVQDGVQAFRDGDYQQAALNGAGAVANSMAFFASGAHQHVEEKMGRSIHKRKSSSEDSSSPASSDDAPSSEGAGNCCLM